MKHKAKFMFDKSLDMYKEIRHKIKSHKNFMMKEHIYKTALEEHQYINELIHEHTPDKELLSRLPNTSTNDRVITLSNW